MTVRANPEPPDSVVIIGAGGHATVAMDACLGSGIAVGAFVDTAGERAEQLFLERPLLSGAHAFADALERYRGFSFFVAIGRNMARLAWTRGLLNLGLPVATITHPAAVVSRSATIAAGCFVGAGAVVGPHASLGQAVIVNTAATVDHHGRLAAGVHLAPGSHLGGRVCVGEHAWVGIGAIVRDHISIGAAALLGCGAVATAPVPTRRVVMGVPASDRRECNASDPHISTALDLAEIQRLCGVAGEVTNSARSPASPGRDGRP